MRLRFMALITRPLYKANDSERLQTLDQSHLSVIMFFKNTRKSNVQKNS